MTHSIYRRNSLFMRFVSVSVALAFTLSLAGSGFAAPSTTSTETPPVAESSATTPEQVATAQEGAASEPPAAPSVEAAPTTTEPTNAVSAEPAPAPVRQGLAEKRAAVAKVAAAGGVRAAGSTSASLRLEGYRTSPGTYWTTGNLGDLYREGDWVPYRMIVDNSNGAAAYTMPLFNLQYDHYSSTKNAIGVDRTRGWRVYYTATQPADGDSNAPGGSTITPSNQDFPYPSGSFGSSQFLETSFADGTVVVPAGQYGVVYFQAHLSMTAYWLLQSPSRYGSSYYPGSSMQMRLNSTAGDKTVPIPIPPKPSGAISGIKFFDANRNGVQDGTEQGLSGWVFHLTGGPSGFPIDLTATSGAGGVFEFPILPSATYSLNEELQSGWLTSASLPMSVVVSEATTTTVAVGNYRPDVTKSWSLVIDALPSGGTALVKFSVNGGALQTVTLTGSGPYTAQTVVPYGATISNISWYVRWAGEDVLLGTSPDETLAANKTNSFTYHSSVAGAKFDDANGNGAWNTGELGLSGWDIVLKRMVGSVETTYAAAKTGTGGAFGFTDVIPGTYYLYEINQPGWLNTKAPTGSFTVARGSAITGKDFGNQFINASVTIDKSGPARAHVGDTITYTMLVTNTGNNVLNNVTVTDPMFSLTRNLGSLASGESTSFTVSRTVLASDPDPLKNTAVVVGTPLLGPNVTASDDHIVDIIKPAISLVKTASPTMAKNPASVTYTYVVTNTGSDPLYNVALTDDHLTVPGGNIGTMTPGQVATLTASATLSATTTNTANVSGTDILGLTVRATDRAVVRVYNPSISIVKSANPTVITSGTPVTYTYLVTNTGDITLTNVLVTDNKLGPIGSLGTLAPGGQGTLTVTTPITVDTVNIGTAYGDYGTRGTEFFGTVSATSSASVDVVHPALHVVKTPSAPVILKGGSVTYTYVVSNTGDVALYNVNVTDDKLGAIGTIAVLPVAGSATLTKSTTLNVTTDNVVTASGADERGNPASDTDTARVVVHDPKITIVKTASPTVIHSGDPVTYTYLVTNTGDVPLDNVTITDDKLGTIGNIGTLAAGAASTVTTVAAVAADTTNVGTVVGGYGDPATTFHGSVTASDDAVVDVIHPWITVRKTVSPSAVIVGGTVTYTYVVTNNGDVPLTNVTVTDDKLGTIGVVGNLAVNASATLTKSTTLSATTTNVATATGLDPLEQQVSDTDSARVPVYNPSISIVKSANPTRILPGTPVTYTYLVTNTGDISLTNLTLNDDKLGLIGTLAMLAPGATHTFTTSAPISVDTHNVGTVVGWYGAAETDFYGSVSASDPADVDVVNPSIHVTKTASAAAVLPGGPVTYTYTVTNTGDTPLVNVVLTDDKLGQIGTVASLAAGASQTFTKSTTLAVTTTNVVTATGVDVLGRTLSDTAPATVAVVSPSISIVKTAAPVTILANETVTYTYTVTNTGNTTLYNVAVSDDKLGAIGTIPSLAPGASATLSTSAAVAADTVNVATAVGTYSVAGGPSGNVSATDDAAVDVIHPAIDVTKAASPSAIIAGDTVTYTYVVTNIGDVPLVNVVLTDDKLGQVGTVANLAVGASQTFTSSAVLSVPTTNTVTAVGTDPLGHQVSDVANAFVEVALPFTPPDVAIDKSADKTTVAAGDTVKYTLTYWNLGPGAAQDVKIVDDFDQRYMTVIDAGGGTVANGTITWNVGLLLPADGKKTVTYTLKVNDPLPAGVNKITNTVVITAPDDTDNSNNSDSWTVTRNEPFLPFTGGDWSLIAIVALLAAAAGVVLRRVGRPVS